MAIAFLPGMVLGEVADESFDVSAGFGRGRDRRGFSVVIILVVAMVAAAVIVFSSEQMG